MKNFLPLFLIFLSSCSVDMEFNKGKWNEKDDFFYKYRKQMVDDLIENHLSSKMTKKEIVEILGQSDYSPTKQSELAFEIYQDYGWDIDPVETQNLVITLDSDSTLDKVYLETWRHSTGTEQKQFSVK